MDINTNGTKRPSGNWSGSQSKIGKIFTLQPWERLWRKWDKCAAGDKCEMTIVRINCYHNASQFLSMPYNKVLFRGEGSEIARKLSLMFFCPLVPNSWSTINNFNLISYFLSLSLSLSLTFFSLRRHTSYVKPLLIWDRRFPHTILIL